MVRFVWQPSRWWVRLGVAGVALTAFNGCVYVSPRGLPSGWAAPQPSGPAQINGRFTGDQAALRQSATIFFAHSELYARSALLMDGTLLQAVDFWPTELSFRCDDSFVTVVATGLDPAHRLERRLPIQWHEGAMVIRSHPTGSEGGIPYAASIEYCISRDADGRLVFRERRSSVGLITIIPAASYETRWWRLSPTGAEPAESSVPPSLASPKSPLSPAPRTSPPPDRL